MASPKVINGDDALSNLPSKSPRRAPGRRLSSAIDVSRTASPVKHAKPVPENGAAFASTRFVEECLFLVSARLCLDSSDNNRECKIGSPSFSERQRIWKEELDKELEMERGKFTSYAYQLHSHAC